MEKELPELKNLYEDLWDDARTLVKDMSLSIRMTGAFGALMLVTSIFELSAADSNYQKIAAGTARWLDYVYCVGGAVGVIVFLIGGVAMIRWYLTLKDRYARVIELEKKLEKR